MKSFVLEMHEIADHVLFVGSSQEGEARHTLDPPTVLELKARSADIVEVLSVSAGIRGAQPGAYQPQGAEHARSLANDAARPTTQQEVRDRVYAYGDYLFELVFDDDLARLLAATQGSLDDGESLRIVLRLGSADLSSILWEVIRDDGRFVAHTVPFVRYPMIRRRCSDSVLGEEPASMLVVAANPLGDLDIHRELDALDHALPACEGRVAMTKLVEEDATFERIDAELKKGPDIFHFMGHAEFNEADPESSYLLISGEGPRGSGRLPLSSIAATMATNPISLVFLNACDTAAGPAEEGADQFVSLAHNLVELGNSCVIAMSHAISDRAAVALTPAFYRSVLVDRIPLDQALKQCKNDMYSGIAQGSAQAGDWCSPVLYSRAQDLAAWSNPAGSEPGPDA